MLRLCCPLGLSCAWLAELGREASRRDPPRQRERSASPVSHLPFARRADRRIRPNLRGGLLARYPAGLLERYAGQHQLRARYRVGLHEYMEYEPPFWLYKVCRSFRTISSLVDCPSTRAYLKSWANSLTAGAEASASQ